MAQAATKYEENETPKDEYVPFSTGENFADLFEGAGSQSQAEGSVVKGTVVGIEKDLAVIDVGLKSEGRIPLREFGAAANELRVGDTFDIYIERFENRDGEAQLSREKAGLKPLEPGAQIGRAHV